MCIRDRCQNQDGLIGDKGKLPFHNKEELKLFKSITSYSIICMGRKTWDSLPSKPLPLRTNIILTRNKDFCTTADNTFVVHSISEVLKIYEGYGDRDLFIIGGKEVYEQFKPYLEEVIISQVNSYKKGDTYITKKDFGIGKPFHKFYGDGFCTKWYKVNKKKIKGDYNEKK